MSRRWAKAAAAVLAVVVATSAPAHAADPRMMLVSTAADGTQGNGPATFQFGRTPPRLSRDGRSVVFSTRATNLAPNNGESRSRVYRKDMKTGAVVQIDVAFGGVGDRRGVDSYLLDMSDDGRFVLYEVDDPRASTPKAWLLRDVVTATTRHMLDRTIALSDDARHALVAGPGARVVDLRTGASTPVPGEGRALSGDGRHVAVVTAGAFGMFDTGTNTLTPVAFPADWWFCNNGSETLDTRGDAMVFQACIVHGGDVTVRAAVSDGSGAFTFAPEVAGRDTGFPTLSHDARFVSFTSAGTSPTTGAFVAEVHQWDRKSGALTTLSTTFDGTPAHPPANGNAVSAFSTYSGDGHYVAYLSSVENLVPDDTNGQLDVFRTRAN